MHRRSLWHTQTGLAGSRQKSKNQITKLSQKTTDTNTREVAEKEWTHWEEQRQSGRGTQELVWGWLIARPGAGEGVGDTEMMGDVLLFKNQTGNTTRSYSKQSAQVTACALAEHSDTEWGKDWDTALWLMSWRLHRVCRLVSMLQGYL